MNTLAEREPPKTPPVVGADMEDDDARKAIGEVLAAILGAATIPVRVSR